MAGKSVKEELYAPSFQTFLDDEKLIFKDCSAKKCRVKIKSEKMPHKINLWKAHVEVEKTANGNKSKISQRSGCYFVENNKIVTYMEDCEDR